MAEIVVGIDLGTTNSEIAAFVDGKPRIIGNNGQVMLPSCVGISSSGDVLIGRAARNQMLLYPDRTVRSVKRLMGTSQNVTLGDKTFTPSEISALILRELVRWAEEQLRQPVRKAVITVPAYFSDAQRNATREAGELAGLEVVRIVNEPTAASLAYGLDVAGAQTVMVYDLGGGTLDVSVVRVEGEVTEVLASHGNNHLGGDDFDTKLTAHLVEAFRQQYGVDLQDQHPGAYARLWWAAEAAKRQLSAEPYARVREESLVVIDGKPLHLDVEISREQYEALIRPLVEQTMESASKALTDAGLLPAALDAILLVGGSTRTPLVVQMLEQRCGKTPRQDLHPDLCVALGAGVLASRLGGHDVERVLVDVSPFSFGISHLGMRLGREYPYCYRPVIRRNTPLPVTRTEEYFTAEEFQTAVDMDVYQGDDPDAMRNVHVGHFRIEGMRPIAGPNPVLCRMRLDLDGILHVTAIEKSTGLSKHVAISGATRQRNAAEVAQGREEIARLFGRRVREDVASIEQAVPEVHGADALNSDAVPESAAVEPSSGDAAAVATDAAEPATGPGPASAAGSAAAETAAGAETVTAPPAPAGEAVAAQSIPGAGEARALVQRCRERLATLHTDDQEEAVGLIEDVESALKDGAGDELASASKALSEFLFFIEGR